jgi:peptidoglycan/LPS O-acetylase OafA/YrhL
MTTADGGQIEPGFGAVWFAHWLRGLSISLIVLGHLGRTFWEQNGTAADLAHVRPLPDATLSRVSELVSHHDNAHAVWPTMALGFFFLASGFLIPLTMDRTSVGRFLFNRLCRIYPAWIVSLMLIAGLFAVEQRLVGIPIGVSTGSWIANAAAVPDLAYQPTINPPGWTLFVEIKWYLLYALAGATFGLTRAWVVGGAAAVFATYAAVTWHGLAPLAAHSHAAWVVTQAFAWDVPHLCMILIGVCIYNHLRNGWSLTSAWLCAGVCFAAMTASSWLIDDGSAYRAAKFAGYVIAVGAFALAYAYRDRFRPNRLIRYIADMVFSLYVVHFVLGMVLIDVFMQLSEQPLISTLAAAAVVVGVSVAVHHVVEVPAIRFGKTWRAGPVRNQRG